MKWPIVNGRVEFPVSEDFLRFAPDKQAEDCRNAISEKKGPMAWAGLQQEFLSSSEKYLKREIEKPVEGNIEHYDAGGQWRIAFSHAAARQSNEVSVRLQETMHARKAFSDKTCYHGYADSSETHNEIETYLYFQLPLFYSRLPGSDEALASIEDVAHHTGNWEKDVPDWFDWDKGEFVSTWLGTKEVKALAPHDHQESGHCRIVNTALAAYIGTGNQRYLDLCISHADRWCEHIEQFIEDKKPVPCSTQPGALTSIHMMFDIASFLMDMSQIVGTGYFGRYLSFARAMLDQYLNSGSERPPIGNRPADWVGEKPYQEPSIQTYMGQAGNAFILTRLALKHDHLTDRERYRRAILSWARSIDERVQPGDQMAASVLSAAHFYDANPEWLERAYAMALRAAAVLEPFDDFEQNNYLNRQAARHLLEPLYQPITGAVDMGTRGNLPVERLIHSTNGARGLPDGVSFRTWRVNYVLEGFEAFNTSSKSAKWKIQGKSMQQKLDAVEIIGKGEANDGTIEIPAHSAVSGRLYWYNQNTNFWKPFV